VNRLQVVELVGLSVLESLWLVAELPVSGSDVVSLASGLGEEFVLELDVELLVSVSTVSVVVVGCRYHYQSQGRECPTMDSGSWSFGANRTCRRSSEAVVDN
jgi:hypothetical protein